MKNMKSEIKGVDQNYTNLIKKVLTEGYLYNDPNRKGVQRFEIPSYTFRHDLKHGFPAITLKKLAWKSVVTECLWFLRGDTNIKYLVDNGCNIWNKDAYNYYLKQYVKQYSNSPQNQFTIYEFVDQIKDDRLDQLKGFKLGDLGKVYGSYWRNFNGVDQITELISDMINKPMSSELLVVARDPSHKEEQALPCCHYGFQIVMRPLTPLECGEQGILSKNGGLVHTGYGFELHFKMRSVDTFLGLPFNIASYALLALILEKITGHKALGIQGDLKKVHLYDNSITEAKELLKRKPSDTEVKVLYKDEFHYITDKSISGNVSLNTIFNEMKPDWFKLEGYNPQEALKVEMLSRTNQ